MPTHNYRHADEREFITLSPAAMNPWVRLGAAVLLQGFRDAKDGDEEAAYWLLSTDARSIAEALGFDPNTIHEWIEQHFQTEVMQ